MARQPRLHYDGALYHVIVRGNNKDYVFESQENKSEYLARLTKYISKYKAYLYGYVIMDNHCHMVIQVSHIPLSKIMQLIQQTYTAWYNRKFGHTGHVFEQRYKSVLCDKDEYLLTLIRYIHQNPIRAGIGDYDYEYSSHIEYRSGIRIRSEVDEVLGYFGSKKKQAIKSYLEFVEELDTEFKEKKSKDLSPDLEFLEIEVNKNEVIKKELDEVIEEFELTRGINVLVLKGKYLDSKTKYLRDQLILRLIDYKVMTQKEIADFIGLSKYQVSRIYNGRE